MSKSNLHRYFVLHNHLTNATWEKAINIEILGFTYQNSPVVALRAGGALGLLYRRILYVLKPSQSRYQLRLPTGCTFTFVCLGGCCDAGVQDDVLSIIETAKGLGAQSIILRGGVSDDEAKIAGLPVKDVSNHVGEIAGELAIVSRY